MQKFVLGIEWEPWERPQSKEAEGEEGKKEAPQSVKKSPPPM
jgi:hypothetical protein